MRVLAPSVAFVVAATTGAPLAWGQAPPALPGADQMAPSLRTEDEGKPKPPASDDRSGHVFVRGSAALVGPAGSVAGDAPLGDVASLGGAFGGGLGVGIARHAELDAQFTYALFSSPERCEGCEASMIGGGLGLTYHLLQGAGIDPWARFGVGYRMADLAGSTATRGLPSVAAGTYHGLDVAQVALGATFQPFPGVGFGPFLGLDLGTFLSRPDDPREPGSRTYAFFQLGLRLELDPVRWVGGASPTREARTLVVSPGRNPL